MRTLNPFIVFFSLMIFLNQQAWSQQVLPLYDGPVPNAREAQNREKRDVRPDSIVIISQVSQPTLTVYLPDPAKASGTAVIICPGGGYRILAASHEGSDVARKFQELGIAAFVLKYRLPDDRTMQNREIGPLQDAQRAIQLVRMHAGKWGIRKNRIGIMGFSAGGHLASTAGTHFNRSYIPPKKRISLRPDFMILAYPVISFTDSLTHGGSRESLIGKSPSPEKIREYSNEWQVTRKTPPTFLMHAQDDDVVKVQNATVFASALERHKVPVSVFLYEKGGHGFGMVNKTSDAPWLEKAVAWMRQQKLLR